jgi:hypothetical protein
MRVSQVLLAVGLLVPIPGHLAAQASDVPGRWAVSWEAGTSTDEAGNVNVIRRTGTLVLAAAGDSLVGTWQAFEGRPVLKIHGRMVDGRLSLRSIPQDVPDQDGNLARVQFVFDGSLRGASLEGTLSMQIADAAPIGPRRWEGTRAPTR